MVNDEWSGAEALENAFRVADQELRKAQRERDEALRKKGEAFDRAVRAERDRDEWKSRAEAAEARTAPIEEKARELYRAATPDARWETVADEYRRIARHVLGEGS